MKIEEAIQQLDDKMIRRFILELPTNILHVYKEPNLSADESHVNLTTQKLGLKVKDVIGGQLLVRDGKFNFMGGSGTVQSANQEEIDTFDGEVDIF